MRTAEKIINEAKRELSIIDISFTLNTLETVTERRDAILKRKELHEILDYVYNVCDIFVTHHEEMGLDHVEAFDLFNESEFLIVERWLKKLGYDLMEGLDSWSQLRNNPLVDLEADENDEEQWSTKGTCDGCGQVVDYESVYVLNGGFCFKCKPNEGEKQ